MEKLLTIEQVAEILQVSPRTISNAPARGRAKDWPPSIKVGAALRWRPATLAAWLAAREGEGGQQSAAPVPQPAGQRRRGRPRKIINASKGSEARGAQ